jgi:hypothetical protein
LSRDAGKGFLDVKKRVEQEVPCKKIEINGIDSLQAKQMRNLIYNALFWLLFLPAAFSATARIAGNPCHCLVTFYAKKNPPGLRRV